MTCPCCDAILDDNAKYCPDCGTIIEERPVKLSLGFMVAFCFILIVVFILTLIIFNNTNILEKHSSTQSLEIAETTK